MKDESVWLNREQLAMFFDRDIKTIGKHINNALNEELDNSVVAKFATTAKDGKDLYPSIQEKAANFLYLITKNHTFIDGNNSLVAITLLIVESNPKEKDILIDLVMNFLKIIIKKISSNTYKKCL